ncbi:hypothetical protein CDV31_014320 [Fusarium ambrosium]|uniref:Protein kinase domain-containing protein n=1 Tax=Fusarium ambrosium TaxID=131363 RepID=A0A428SXG9_9HYPO|nr:hypothetical protein CDV31_014320 [Fusarium ambrosium]
METIQKENISLLQSTNAQSTRKASETVLPFISQEPKVGDPPLDWEDFEKPRLRQFPGTRDDIRLRRFLGRGADGLIIKARIRGREDPVVIKTFFFNHQPPPVGVDSTVSFRRIGPADPNSLRERHYQFHNRSKREPCRGAERYWAFERECINCTLLEKIESCFRRAKAAGRQIRLNPNPKTKAEALENLRAIAAAGSKEAPSSEPDNSVVFAPDVRITRCLGWTQIKGSDINHHLIQTKAECWLDLKDDEIYYANIYDYIPRGQVDLNTLVRQLDFFHVTGFINVSFNEANWRGSGVLVDFSDIVSPFARHPWWQPSAYLVNQEKSRKSAQCYVTKTKLKGVPESGSPSSSLESHSSGILTIDQASVNAASGSSNRSSIGGKR